MAALFPVFLCALLFSPVFAFSSSPLRKNAHAGGIIQATCSMTGNYDFCVAALQSDPRSRKAGDVKALSAAAVKIVARDARNASSCASRMTKNATGEAPLKSALRTCAEKYRYAGEALRSAAASLAGEDYDSAYVDVSAAAEYADACGRAFRRQPGLSYPEEMARREDGFKRLCATVQDIISQLG